MTKREVYDEARRRLVERYLTDHPEAKLSSAHNIVESRHEEMGAMMDWIEGRQ